MRACTAVHVAINSLASYDVPRTRLLRELASHGVPMGQVHVFLGGAGKEGESAEEGRYADPTSGAWFYRVPHNSVDFTTMVHLAENPQLFPTMKQFFYLHDTSSVGPGFWPNATHWCKSGLPACALPLTRYLPTSSMGLYDAKFIWDHASDVAVLKNSRGATGMRWKIRGVGWEDKMFKVCDANSADKPIRRFTRQCYNKVRARACSR